MATIDVRDVVRELSVEDRQIASLTARVAELERQLADAPYGSRVEVYGDATLILIRPVGYLRVNDNATLRLVVSNADVLAAAIRGKQS